MSTEGSAYRCMLVSRRQFAMFAFGADGVEQIEGARKRLAEMDLFPEIPVLTLNVLRCEMGWPSAVARHMDARIRKGARC